MTMAEAYSILDVVAVALRDISHRHHPVSALKGHDIYQICTAIKLRIVNEVLLFAGRNDFQKLFEDWLKLDDSVFWTIVRSFVPDDQVDSITAVGVFNPIDPSTMTFKDQRWGDEELASSFCHYCRGLGTNDPIYWQKVYTRLGLEYTSTSPKGNTPYRAGEISPPPRIS